jgi:hypothetical protein
MQNNTYFDTYLNQKLKDPLFKYFYERELQMLATDEAIKDRNECEKVIVDLVNRVGLDAFFLGLSDAFYGDEIDEGGRRLRRELDDKLGDFIDLVRGG